MTQIQRKTNGRGGRVEPSDSQRRPRMRITSVALENWKNFTRVEVQLQRRVFLVGPNASGKSNFLDAFRFLRDVVSVGGGFRAAVTQRQGVSAIRSLAARRYPDIALRVTLGTDEESVAWRYSLGFKQDNQGRPIITSERVSRNGSILLSRPDEHDAKDAERLTQTHLEQVNVNREFREVADFLADIRYRHIVPQLVREPDRSVGRRNDPFGGDFLEQIAGTNQRIQKARLRRIKEALQVAVPQLMELNIERDDRGTPHLRGRYEHWRHKGAWQTEEQFSDGTLRLMGLLWSMVDGTGPLLLEEPELSLHPEVVRYVPQMFARMQRRTGRQVIVSSHSRDLLQDSGIGLDEVLLLLPEHEGTRVATAESFEDIKALLEGGADLADAVIPKTRPSRADQLVLFESS